MKNEILILNLIIIKLKRILPIENFKFIEEESLKIHKFLDNLYVLDHYSYEISYAKEGLKLYNNLRPKCDISDNVLLDIIAIYFQDGLPGEIEHIIRGVEKDIVEICPENFRIELTEKEYQRQKKLENFKGWQVISEEILLRD